MDDIAAAPEVGPVLVTVEYRVQAERQKEFEKLIGRYGRVRRRDGASRWGIFRDMGSDDRYVEVFMVSSWAEHLRQHERLTRADEELENKIRECVGGDPEVRHLLYVAR
jgi:hypothetical protein